MARSLPRLGQLLKATERNALARGLLIGTDD